MIKMKDIAKIANVSEATVSRALNNKSDISPKTREKILKIIEEYDYIPNTVARSLYKHSSNIVGVVIPDLINPYFPEIVQSITTELAQKEYNIMLFNTQNNPKIEETNIRTIASMHMAGLIIIAPNIHSLKYEHLNIPIVSIDGYISDRVPHITSNFYQGAKMAVHILKKNHCKKVVHVSGPLIYQSSYERYNGFIEQAKEEALDFDVIQTKLDGKDEALIRDYFTKHTDIDGVFAANDSLAFLCIRVFSEIGVQVPKDIRIIGYDNNFLAKVVNPPLSTIAVPIANLGKQAVTTLLKMTNSETYESSYVFDVDYLKRKTTWD